MGEADAMQAPLNPRTSRCRRLEPVLGL